MSRYEKKGYNQNSAFKKGKDNPNYQGNKGIDSPRWKGDDVGYKALHKWIKNHKPKPKVCENCKKNKPYDLANISGKYKRDVKDFEWLCRKCHQISDGRYAKLKRKGKNNPHWKGGFPLCIDCGTKTKNSKAKRCWKCYLKTL